MKDEADADFGKIIKDVQHKACERAEQMRKINGIKLDSQAYDK